MDPQGIAHFPGLKFIRAASMTFSHGISPSSALVQITPQSGFVPEAGTLRFSFAGTVINFPGALIDSASLRVNPQGYIWSLRIFDRRWKWRFGELYGWYNRKLPDGKIDDKLEKTPQELATLCLQAMGEPQFDVSGLPDNARPEVNWVAANPANELANLCDTLGCRVALGLDNRVSTPRTGVGANLPVSLAINEGFGIDPPNRPDKFKISCGPNVYQNRWHLEAVGRDADGSVKPIDDLGYKPTDGWGSEFAYYFDGTKAFGGNTAEQNRLLAVETVYRWYRIKQQADASTIVPGHSEAVKIFQVLPLLDRLAEAYVDADAEEFSKKPRVGGVRWDEGIAQDILTDSEDPFTGSFSLDRERGIVQFSEAVFQRTSSSAGVPNSPADLWLEVAHHIQDADTRQALRHERERLMPGVALGTQVDVFRREEIVRVFRATYDSTGNVNGVEDNQADVDTEADYYLDARQAEFTNPGESIDVEYAGLLPISPDGAIQQVSWQVGPGSAKTRASRNTEFDVVLPDYKQRRAVEEQREQRKEGRTASRSSSEFKSFFAKV